MGVDDHVLLLEQAEQAVAPTAGRSVWNRVDGFPLAPGGLTGFLNVPWIVLPVDVTSETLPAVTCARK